MKEKLKKYAKAAATFTAFAGCVGLAVYGSFGIIENVVLGVGAIYSGALTLDIINGLPIRKTKATSQKNSTEKTSHKSHNMTYKLSKMVVKADSKQDGLLTRAFARPPKDNDHDREWAAKIRLQALRRRDASGKKMTVKNYIRQGR